jgi:hypothetical protein
VRAAVTISEPSLLNDRSCGEWVGFVTVFTSVGLAGFLIDQIWIWPTAAWSESEL